ncbi:MAG: helix-turn-helix transcriptional regulator [Bacteroidota bacterium]|nr:helix-turn-helix transcriptional regulator [Bacteroidota bacterium]MDP4233316.1 helix-turn-helix transcriptional regulator [Bacteroidota bacterium]MDP4242064.1 helix-turn-helix transcriptional regulator [Bacteroidota bacterium]MDP4288658.1 helix-turn-helix transcriptional regulator [Bacteroidota bacterium]
MLKQLTLVAASVLLCPIAARTDTGSRGIRTGNLVNAQTSVSDGRFEPWRPSPTRSKRRHRKRHLAWEQAELAADGLYAHNLQDLEARFPRLTPMELRVCALAKAMLPSWKIGEILGICEKTVENHLRDTRLKLGLPPGTRLHHLLSSDGLSVEVAPVKEKS